MLLFTVTEKFMKILMQMTCDEEHEQYADYGSHSDRYPFGSNKIEIEHKSHTRRDEKECHVGYQEFADRCDCRGPDPPSFKTEAEYKHPPDASGNVESGYQGEQLSDCETCEDNAELSGHDKRLI